MAKVTEKEIIVHQDSAKNYVEAAKNVIDVIVANIPGLTQESVITETTSMYRVRCKWKGYSDLVVELGNGSGNGNSVLYAYIMYYNGEDYMQAAEIGITDTSNYNRQESLVYGKGSMNRIRIITDENIWRIDVTDSNRTYGRGSELYLTTLLDRNTQTTVPVIGGGYNNLYISYQNQAYVLSVSASTNSLSEEDNNYYAVPIILRSDAVPVSGKIAGVNDYYEVYLHRTLFSVGDRTRFSVGGAKFYAIMQNYICAKEA